MTSRKGEENRFKGKFLSDTTLSGNEYSPDRVKKSVRKKQRIIIFRFLNFWLLFRLIKSFRHDLQRIYKERDEKITERSIRF